MTRHSILAAIGCLVGTASAQPAQQTPVFRTVVDSVAVDVSVTQGGRPVTRLTADDFDVRDNDVPQTIADVTYETQPIDVTLIVDMSGSVKGPLFSSLTRALDDIDKRLRPTDRARLVTFDEHLEGRPPRQPGVRLAEGLKATTGQTALLDAIATSLLTEPRTDRRQLAIVFTDGRDNVSILDEAAVIEVAKRSEPTVFVVALSTALPYAVRTVPPNVVRGSAPAPQPVPPPHDGLFTTLAELTGGRFAVLRRDQDLSSSFTRAFDDFRTSYVLRYVAKGMPRGGWHTLTVTVKRSGTYEVRARKGYQG